MVVQTPDGWPSVRSRDPRRLVLGSVQWGMPYGVANHQGPPDDAELIRMLERAREAGVDTIDTARAYGAAEARIGQALPRVPGPRRWHVITKLAPDVHDVGVELAESLERVAASLAASREALGIDPPPDLLLHRFAHRSAEAGRLWGALLAERDAGRIGRLGRGCCRSSGRCCGRRPLPDLRGPSYQGRL